MNAEDERLVEACQTLRQANPGSVESLCAALYISAQMELWRAWEKLLESISSEQQEALRRVGRAITEEAKRQAEQEGTAP